VDSFTLRPLYDWGKSLRYGSDRRLGGSQNTRTGVEDVEKNEISPLPGIELSTSVVKPVASCYLD
jgi:hypothetical protein